MPDEKPFQKFSLMTIRLPCRFALPGLGLTALSNPEARRRFPQEYSARRSVSLLWRQEKPEATFHSRRQTAESCECP